MHQKMSPKVHVRQLTATGALVLILNCQLACGINITLATTNNNSFEQKEPIECTTEGHGIVFKFTSHKSADTVRLAECQFGSGGYYQLMDERFKGTYSVTQTHLTCILTILNHTEDLCGTYTCSVMYAESEYISHNISCNDIASDAKNIPVQNNSGKIWIIVGSVLSVCAFIGVCIVAVVKYREGRLTAKHTEINTSQEGRLLLKQGAELQISDEADTQRSCDVHDVDDNKLSTVSNTSDRSGERRRDKMVVNIKGDVLQITNMRKPQLSANNTMSVAKKGNDDINLILKRLESIPEYDSFKEPIGTLIKIHTHEVEKHPESSMETSMGTRLFLEALEKYFKHGEPLAGKNDVDTTAKELNPLVQARDEIGDTHTDPNRADNASDEVENIEATVFTVRCSNGPTIQESEDTGSSAGAMNLASFQHNVSNGKETEKQELYETDRSNGPEAPDIKSRDGVEDTHTDPNKKRNSADSASDEKENMEATAITKGCSNGPTIEGSEDTSCSAVAMNLANVEHNVSNCKETEQSDLDENDRSNGPEVPDINNRDGVEDTHNDPNKKRNSADNASDEKENLESTVVTDGCSNGPTIEESEDTGCSAGATNLANFHHNVSNGKETKKTDHDENDRSNGPEVPDIKEAKNIYGNDATNENGAHSMIRVEEEEDTSVELTKDRGRCSKTTVDQRFNTPDLPDSSDLNSQYKDVKYEAVPTSNMKIQKWILTEKTNYYP